MGNNMAEYDEIYDVVIAKHIHDKLKGNGYKDDNPDILPYGFSVRSFHPVTTLMVFGVPVCRIFAEDVGGNIMWHEYVSDDHKVKILDRILEFRECENHKRKLAWDDKVYNYSRELDDFLLGKID